MRIENTFHVPAAPDAAWELLMDVRRVIPCMPGAELTDVVDDSTWKAKMNVKLGPVALTFATDLKRDAVDESARRARLSARARELRGRGAGQAVIESTLTPADGGTTVAIVTDLTLSGAVAQYGRGLVEDISSQLVGRFAECLRAQLSSGPEPSEQVEPPPPPAAPQPAKPVGGISLALAALGRSTVRTLRRLLRRARERSPL
jgi:uncharacterized protein